MDYRALAGEGTPALLLAEESPLRWGEEVLASLGKPVENIVGQIDGLQRQAALHREGTEWHCMRWVTCTCPWEWPNRWMCLAASGRATWRS